MFQGKFLFNEYKPGKAPGIALVTGSFLPGGQGAFVPPGYGAFAFLIASQALGKNEDVLIHANIGQNYLPQSSTEYLTKTWGIGTQIRTYRGFHLVGEFFSGDPYILGTGLAYQAGFRHFISDLIQVDATVGQGVGGQNKMPFWFSAGARLVTTKFARKK